MMFVSFYSNMTGVTSRAETVHSSGASDFPPPPPPVFSGVRVGQSFVFCVMFCRSLFVLLSFLSHCIVCPSSILEINIP